MKESIIVKLTSKDDSYACAVADQVISESRETAAWYEYWNEFAALLDHPKSLVRNRVLAILAANAQWDEASRFDSIFSNFLAHVANEKPICRSTRTACVS